MGLGLLSRFLDKHDKHSIKYQKYFPRNVKTEIIISFDSEVDFHNLSLKSAVIPNCFRKKLGIFALEIRACLLYEKIQEVNYFDHKTNIWHFEY